MVTLRHPVVEDAPALAAVHVRAWQEAYRGGLMPDAYLDALSIDERAAMWRDGLQRPPRPRAARFVADDERDGIVGFITVGPADGEDGADLGEVYAVNVDPDAWGRGVGRTLLAAGVDALAAAGFGTAVLWVHPDNARARRFYGRSGWAFDGAERRQEVLGVEVPEARYRRTLRR
jgi:ribosomal protein S18 acetylase RimI-like enzyme